MIFYYVFCYVFYPRNIFFAFHLNKVLKSAAPKAVFDVGFGEGLHLIPFAILYPKVKFYGFDIRKENRSFLLCISSFLKLKNVAILTEEEFYQTNIQTFDVIYMVGVLQYVEKDGDFLRFLKKKLINKGCFLLYQPVHYFRYFKILNDAIDKFDHYEKEVNLRREYIENELLKIIDVSGFKVCKIYRFMFKYSSMAQEIFRYFYIPLVKSPNLLEKLVGFVGIVFFSPIIIIGSHLGNFMKTNDYNAVLILLEN